LPDTLARVREQREPAAIDAALYFHECGTHAARDNDMIEEKTDARLCFEEL
jgi:hypothetical protein